MRKINSLVLATLAFVAGFPLCNTASALCTLPYQLTNGQTADATQVMANLNALAACLSSAPAGSNNAVQYNAGSGAFGGVGPLGNGQVVIGTSGNAPQAGTITAGSGIAIANGPGSITISATGGGTVPNLIQSGFDRTTVMSGPASGTVTLPSTPVVGNILVAVATGYGGTAVTLGVPPAFSTVYANIANASPNQGIVVGARVVQAGDSATWSGFAGGNGGNVFGVLEFSGAHAIQANATQGIQANTAWPFFSGASVNAYTFFVFESDTTNTYSSITGASLLYDGTSSAANHPALVATTLAGTAGSGVVNYSSSNFGNSLFTTISVIP